MKISASCEQVCASVRSTGWSFSACAATVRSVPTGASWWVAVDVSTGSERGSLPADTALGRVHLRVASHDRSLAFYRDMLGLAESRHEGNRVELTTRARQPLLTLTEIPGTQPRPQGVVG